MKITEEGAKNEAKLIASVLEFLRLLWITKISDHELIWKEMQSYRRVWLEQSMAFLEPFKNVEKMAKALRWHSHEHPQHIIPAYTQFLEFDAKVIFSVLEKLLQVDKMNIMVMSNKFFQGHEVDNIYWDSYYKLQFAFRGFELSELTMWKDAVSKTKVSLDKFQFPELNIFTTKVCYLTPERRKIIQKEIKEGHKTHGESNSTSSTLNGDKKVWSGLCTKFMDMTYPWATFDLEIVSKVDTQTVRRQALTLILRYSWNHELRAVLGMGKQAGLNSNSFTTSYQGLSIHIEGFDKMAMFLMLKIIQFIKLKIEQVNGDKSCRGDIDIACHFDIAKEFYIKLFQEMYLGPEMFARYILELLKRNKQISHFDLLNEFYSLKREEFRNFYHEFLSSLEFELFGEGTICRSEFEELLKELQSISVKPLESWQHNPELQGQLIKLDKGIQVVWRHLNLNPMDLSTFYLSYYQIGSKPEPLIPGLVKMMFKYFFIHIRYTYIMAYSLGVHLEESVGIEGEIVQGVKFHIRGFCDKFNVNQIDQAMTEFIECFMNQLKAITKNTFRKLQRTYFKKVKEKFSLQDLIEKFDSYFRPNGSHYARATIIVEGRKSIREDFMNHVRYRQNKPIKASLQLPIDPSTHEKPIKISPITSQVLSSCASPYEIKYIKDLQEFQQYADYFRRMPIKNE